MGYAIVVLIAVCLLLIGAILELHKRLRFEVEDRKFWEGQAKYFQAKYLRKQLEEQRRNDEGSP